ncbi:hypothetical protein P4E94_07055 [Pontiellaceae bacterium B12219]|nr:hypothetical protein [Pontiellaceae bacterium B12219]
MIALKNINVFGVVTVFALFMASTAEAAFHEAEDAVIAHGSISADASASGGSYVDGNGSFNLTWNIDTHAGAKLLTFSLSVPSTGAGTRSMGVFVNGTQVGVVSSISTVWEEITVEAAMVDGINTLELRDTEGTAEPDVDYVFISDVTTFSFEAEDAVYLNGGVKTNAAASGGEYLDGNENFNVTWNVDAAGGDYILSFGVKVPSGDRTMGVFVNSNQVGTVNSVSTSWEEVAVESVLLDGLNTIELRDSEGTTELDVDYIHIAKIITFGFEAENMVLDGYAVETNSAASGGELVVLQGAAGSVSEILTEMLPGYYDLTVGYFDETDGEAAFKIYLNDRLVDAWLADRMLGSSEALSVNRMERTVKNVYLRVGDRLEISGFAEGGEGARIDGYNLATAVAPVGVSMDWKSDGTISSLVLNGAEHIGTYSDGDSSVILRIFDGYGIDALEQFSAEENGSVVEVSEESLDYARFYFRMDEYDHHIALRLIGMDGVPRVDPSLSIRLEIPYTVSFEYQALDEYAEISDNGSVLTLDWSSLASRGLLAGGQVVLYATADATAAEEEIRQVYTDNGTLDAYYLWMTNYPGLSGTDADLFADPDLDGLNNLSEYALGGVPTLGNDGVYPGHGISGSDFAIQYNRRIDAAERGLTYTVNSSDNLINPAWTNSGVVEVGTAVLDAEFESVTNTVPTLGTVNRFLKLDIELSK